MDWRSVKFDWNHARAFLVTAEEGSLSAAARALTLTQPTLGRQVSALETELGVTLFERVGRGLTLTQSGIDLLEHVQSMGVAAGRVSLTASGRSQNVEGNVCISVSEIYAALVMPDIVAKIRQAQPGITIEILASNEVSDLQRREADIAIRSFRPTQTELIAKKLKDLTAAFYATPAYLDTLGKVTTAEDLNRAKFISIGSIDAFIRGVSDFGLTLTEENIPVRSENHIVHWEMTKAGLGIGVVPTDIGDAEPMVQRVMPDFELMEFPIWLTSHRELRTSKRIRLVFDLLSDALSES